MRRVFMSKHAFWMIMLLLAALTIFAGKADAQAFEGWKICGDLQEGEKVGVCYNANWDIPFDEFEANTPNYRMSKVLFDGETELVRFITFTDTRGVVVQLSHEPGKNKIVFREDVYPDLDQYQEVIDEIVDTWEYNPERGTYWLFGAVEASWGIFDHGGIVKFFNHHNATRNDSKASEPIM